MGAGGRPFKSARPDYFSITPREESDAGIVGASSSVGESNGLLSLNPPRNPLYRKGSGRVSLSFLLVRGRCGGPPWTVAGTVLGTVTAMPPGEPYPPSYRTRRGGCEVDTPPSHVGPISGQTGIRGDEQESPTRTSVRTHHERRRAKCVSLAHCAQRSSQRRPQPPGPPQRPRTHSKQLGEGKSGQEWRNERAQPALSDAQPSSAPTPCDAGARVSRQPDLERVGC